MLKAGNVYSRSDMEALKNMSVLYVEDDEDIKEQLSLFLSNKVGELYLASDGNEGLKVIEEHNPDIVITDIRMPRMDGLSMAKTIKDEYAEKPIIIITAYNENDYLLDSIDIGIERYILKPTDPNLLLMALLKSASALARRLELEEKNRYIRFILDSNPSFIMTTNGDAIEYVNRTFLDYLGYRSMEAFKREHVFLGDFFSNADIVASNPENLPASYSGSDESCLVHLHGKYAEDPGAFIITGKRSEDINRSILTFTDVSMFEKENSELRAMATTDQLTGLMNRKGVSEMFTFETVRALRYRSPLSLIMMDIDLFKSVNDTFGHIEGDFVLRELALLVADNTSHSDHCARWGGDEFLVLLPNNNQAEAEALAEKLRKMVEANRFPNAKEVSCSFGVTEFRMGDSIETFIQRADDALYQSKENGRNRVTVR